MTKKIGSGEYECTKCGETIFDTTLHECTEFPYEEKPKDPDLLKMLSDVTSELRIEHDCLRTDIDHYKLIEVVKQVIIKQQALEKRITELKNRKPRYVPEPILGSLPD